MTLSLHWVSLCHARTQLDIGAVAYAPRVVDIAPDHVTQPPAPEFASPSERATGAPARRLDAPASRVRWRRRRRCRTAREDHGRRDQGLTMPLPWPWVRFSAWAGRAPRRPSSPVHLLGPLREAARRRGHDKVLRLVPSCARKIASQSGECDPHPSRTASGASPRAREPRSDRTRCAGPSGFPPYGPRSPVRAVSASEAGGASKRENLPVAATGPPGMNPRRTIMPQLGIAFPSSLTNGCACDMVPNRRRGGRFP
jgi:hypothetical protein